jgi:hypothetical protein
LSTILASYSDPNYRQDQVAQLGAVLARLGQRVREAKERKRQEEQQSLDFFLRASQQYPEIATSAYAAQMRDKWGKSNPEVVAVLDVLAQREGLRKTSEGAYEKYLRTLGETEAAYDQKEALAQGPDTLFAPLTGWGMPMQLPNLPALEARQAIEQIPRGALPLAAAQKLTPRERAAARAEAKRRGDPMASEFDPFQDLDAKAKGVLAGQMGLIEGDTARATRYIAELESSQADVEYRDWAAEQAETKAGRDEAGQEFSRAERLEKQRHAIEQEGRRHANRMKEIAANKASRRGSEKKEEPSWTKDPKPDVARELQDLADDNIKSWREELKRATEEAKPEPGNPSAKAKKITQWKTANPAPGRVPSWVTRKIVQMVQEGVSSGAVPAEGAEALAFEVLGQVQALIGSGKSPEQALKEADPFE